MRIKKFSKTLFSSNADFTELQDVWVWEDYQASKEISDYHRVVNDTTNSGPSVTVTGKANFIKGRKIIKSNSRYVMCDLAKYVGIKLSLVHFNLKHILQVHGLKSVVAKRTSSTKEILFCTPFFLAYIVVQIPVPKAKLVTGG